MLPQFYQTHLQKYLSETQLITLKLLVWLLQSQKTVKIERLAATLPLPIQQNSRRRHIQRFLNLTRLSVVILWFPLIKGIIAQRISKGKQLIIALDRTQWKENNILMASVIYQKRALPIFWILLDKKGASLLREQQIVLRPVIKLFKAHQLMIIGDRFLVSNWRTGYTGSGSTLYFAKRKTQLFGKIDRILSPCLRWRYLRG